MEGGKDLAGKIPYGVARLFSIGMSSLGIQDYAFVSSGLCCNLPP